MKRILILLISVFLLTGCSINYDLVITDDETIIEKVVITVDNKTALEQSNSIEEYLDYYSNIYVTEDGIGKFQLKTKKGRQFSKFIVTNEYEDLDKYVNSYSFHSLFNNASIERVGNYVTVITSENEYLKLRRSEEYLDENFYYEELKINIKFYNKVVSHNADYVDEKNNVYTWDVMSDNPKEFMTFKFSNEKRYDVIIKDWTMRNILPISIIGGVIVIAICFGIYVIIVRKNNDRI